jgi:hypothetical protein
MNSYVAAVAKLVLGTSLLSTVVIAQAQSSGFQPNAAAIRAHTRFLSDDLLEGRDTGSRGEALAAAYIGAQLDAFGLAPGGSDGTYYQAVPMMQAKAADHGRFTLITKAGVEQSLAFGEDYLPAASFTQPEQRISAALAFVGFGIVAPERRFDSYAAIDVRGKIVVVLSGAPGSFPSEERGYYSSATLKRQEAAKHGAVALITIYTPTAQRVRAFEHLVERWDDARATWVDASGIPFSRGVPQLAVLSLSGGRKLFDGAPVSFDNVMRAAESKEGKVRSFALPGSAALELRSSTTTSRGANVVGIVPGSDARLKNEYVVLSAHYDHLGVKAGAEGDAIYNGALDNAAGVAVLLEMARGFMQAGQQPRRSLLFVFVTGEERGLVGSDYFARNPTVARAGIVANLNVDMPVLTYDFTDVVSFGASHSSLGPVVTRVAQGMGIMSSPDPVPEQTVFIRSDHFSFVQQGIPAIMVATGFAGPGGAAYADFLEHRYHQLNDDSSQSLNYAAGAKYAALMYASTSAVANEEQQPSWNAGDFFGTRIKP